MRKIFSVMIICVISLSAFGQSNRKALKAGKAFMESQRYNDAVVQFTNAIQLNPTDISAYAARGEAFEMLEKFQESYDDYEKARVFDPKDVDVLFLLGRVSNKMDNYEEALKHLNYASKIARREGKIYPEKIKSYIELESYNRALQASDTALKLKQDELNYYQYGLAFDNLMNYERAKEAYKKSISKNKQYVPARIAMAGILIMEGNLEEAMEHCTYLIEANDRNTEAYRVRSMIYKEQLDYPNAINDISRNILIEPDAANHYAVRGTYYQEFNQHANAVNDFSKAISLNESNPDYFFARANSYEQLMDFEKAQTDYLAITVLSEFDMKARKMLSEAKERLYEINREAEAPQIEVSNLAINVLGQVDISGDAEKILISGSITEESPLKSLTINGNESLFEAGSKGVYEFLTNVDIEDVDKLEIVALDDYDNKTNLTYDINRTEVDPPDVIIVAPFTGDDGQIMLKSNNRKLYIQGKITDKSKIRSIFIEGVTASYEVDILNPDFTATIDVFNKKKITVIAEDAYGNRQSSEFQLNREGAAISASNPMGKTWVVFVENSNYSTFASLDGPVKDVNLMKGALANYQIHNYIHKKDLTKEEMEKFFSKELRDQIRENQVKSLLIWYAGHGKFVNETGYWIPIDASREEEYTYYAVSTLRAAMEPYVNTLTHTLVVTDACESGPTFYTQTRATLIDRSCDDYTHTQFKSSQVFSSAGNELASDDSQFTRTFANSLIGNQNSCLPIDDIVLNVSMAVTNNNQQKPSFGLITGLKDDNGTFFFIAK
jgi:tetratricopeptide (TPR) repeat protein